MEPFKQIHPVAVIHWCMVPPVGLMVRHKLTININCGMVGLGTVQGAIATVEVLGM